MKRFLGILFFTCIVVYLMAAPDTSPGIAEASNLLGGTETTDTIGHVILFTLLTFAWYLGFRLRWSPNRGLLQAVIIAILIGTCTEFAQGIIPHRGMSFGDFLANWGGVGVFVVLWKISPLMPMD